MTKKTVPVSYHLALLTKAIMSNRERITSLTDNDILLGRGLRVSQFTGNKRFLNLIKTRKDEYVATNSYISKAEIAQQVYHELVECRGGRFLSPVQAGEVNADVVRDGVWRKVTKKAALTKIKQALREKIEYATSNADSSPTEDSIEETEHVGQESGESESAEDENNASPVVADTDAAKQNDVADSLPSDGVSLFEIESSELKEPATGPSIESDDSGSRSPAIRLSSLSPVPPRMVTNSESSSDMRVLLYQSPTHSGPLFTTQLHSNDEQSLLLEPLPIESAYLNDNRSSQEDVPESVASGHGLAVANQDMQRPSLDRTTRYVPNGLDPIMENGETVSESLLTMLGFGSDQPRFTPEDEARERAAMTDDEKASVLADTFGKLRVQSNHTNKKARSDLDDATIAFLLRQMKLAIVNLSMDKKQALLEATSKCKPHEFADERLLVFLKSEGMNATLAAERFAYYWECRKELFGPEKYTLPITLNGALCDDSAALESGAFSLLPSPDLSGRRIVVMRARCDTKEGYDTEGLIRILWHIVEVITHEPNYNGDGFVGISWNKGCTVFDYQDHKLMLMMKRLVSRAWPTKAMPVHVCCCPEIVNRAVVPVVFCFMGKHMRSRFVIHDVPETQVVQSLSAYGITKDILPVEMGGEAGFKLSDWIRVRRAIEMEEL